MSAKVTRKHHICYDGWVVFWINFIQRIAEKKKKTTTKKQKKNKKKTKQKKKKKKIPKQKQNYISCTAHLIEIVCIARAIDATFFHLCARKEIMSWTLKKATTGYLIVGNATHHTQC